MTPLLIYIHGFLSSPQSQKAREVAEYIAQQQLPVELQAPALPNYPGAAHRQLVDLVSAQPEGRPVALIGSSLGGFMATALAEQFGLPAVLVNPSVRPYQHAAHFLGSNVNPYSGEQFHIDDSHIAELRAIEPPALRDPNRYLVLVQTGDEVLDYRQAVAYYQGSEQIVEAGGDHRFQNFPAQLPRVFTFLRLHPAA